jgi:FkbM family methyltransferase
MIIPILHRICPPRLKSALYFIQLNFIIFRLWLSRLFGRIVLLFKIGTGPYPFLIKELWGYNPYSGWTSPKVKLLSQEGDFDKLEICGSKFFWPAKFDSIDLPWLYHEVFTPVAINPHSYEFGKVKINPGEWVIDAGASEGFFTRYALDRGAKVLSIEPVKLLYEALMHTFKEEIQQGRVRILQGSLGKKSAMATVHVNPRYACLTKTEKLTLEALETIDVYTVDDIVSKGIIKDVGFIKMDIEGSEIEALEGCKNTLKLLKPRLSVAVYHDLYNAKRIRQMIYAVRSDYKVRLRGIYAWDKCRPRPYMALAL